MTFVEASRDKRDSSEKSGTMTVERRLPEPGTKGPVRAYRENNGNLSKGKKKGMVTRSVY